jgi:hypothetical protein
MQSPFPGLDPYLEAFWSNVHTSMMTYIRDQMQTQLPPGLWTRVEESVTVDSPDGGEARVSYPDVHVTDEQPWSPVWKQEAAGGTAVMEPLVIKDEPLTSRHLEIIDTRSGGRVVTALEILSPGNKMGLHKREQYRLKQAGFLAAGANLVEIDLIRAGEYNLSAPEEKLPQKARWRGGLICVYRTSIAFPEWEVYPLSLRERLPAFCVPLRRGDADVILDLQAIHDQCYRNGSYHLGINYTQPPEPDVAEEDRPWVDALLREKGLR